MAAQRVVFITQSVLYSKILRTCLTELLPRAVIIQTQEIAEALSALQSHPANLLIIDTALAGVDIVHFVGKLLTQHANTNLCLLCENKYADTFTSLAATHTRLFVTDKPIAQDYDANLLTIRKGIRLCLFRIQQRSRLGVGEITHGEPEWSMDSMIGSAREGSAFSLMVIASSTGGPEALHSVLTRLRYRAMRMPILIVQHMPVGFTRNLAENLSRVCSLPIHEAKDGDSLTPSHVYIAPGGLHMELNPHRHISLHTGELVNGVRPAADVLFQSVAQRYAGEQVLALVLTGMGNDGTEGVRALKQYCHCHCVTQDEATSVVFGMPRAVQAARLADKVLPLDDIADYINSIV